MIITDIKELKKVSNPVTDKEVPEVVTKLQEELKTSSVSGFGLAAIQIGIPLQIAWYSLKAGEEGITLVNSKITETSKPFVFPGEGCLSIPGRRFNTKRFDEIILENNGRTCMASGIEAIIIQHEIDHMNGILITDRAYKAPQGRNEKCACGSGQKFKKCCGK